MGWFLEREDDSGRQLDKVARASFFFIKGEKMRQFSGKDGFFGTPFRFV